VSAFVGSASAVRAARCERSHRDHSESPGAGVEADAWASSRVSGGTAWSGGRRRAGTGSGVDARTSLCARPEVRSADGRAERRAASPAGRQSLVGGRHGGHVSLLGDLGETLQQPGRDQGELLVDPERDLLTPALRGW
jgi:hypothetical protein